MRLLSGKHKGGEDPKDQMMTRGMIVLHVSIITVTFWIGKGGCWLVFISLVFSSKIISNG